MLLNATPIWGSDLPGWDGRLPAPPVPRAVGRALFDLVRHLVITPATGRALFDLVRSPATITTPVTTCHMQMLYCR